MGKINLGLFTFISAITSVILTLVGALAYYAPVYIWLGKQGINNSDIYPASAFGMLFGILGLLLGLASLYFEKNNSKRKVYAAIGLAIIIIFWALAILFFAYLFKHACDGYPTNIC